MIVSISSAIAEDVQYLPRLEEMLNRFLPLEKRRAASAVGFGLASGGENGSDHLARTIAASGEQRVVWKPLSSGILNCGKLSRACFWAPVVSRSRWRSPQLQKSHEIMPMIRRAFRTRI